MRWSVRALTGLTRARVQPLQSQSFLIKSLFADKDVLLREKDAALARADAAQKRADALLDATQTRADALHTSAMRDKDALLAEVRASAARAVAAAKHEADVAKGVVNARGLFEACVADIYRELALVGRKVADGGGVSGRFARLIAGDCPELVEYLDKLAADNHVPQHALRAQASELYKTLSELSHAESAARDSVVVLPTAVFGMHRLPRLLAFVGLVRFANRDLRLYKFEDGSVIDIEFILGEPKRISAELKRLS
jgi:hypothetical protein